MRNAHVALASLLGLSAGAYVLPAVGAGPVHFRVTAPHSVTAMVPDGLSPVTVTFPTTPLELIVTDITWATPSTHGWNPHNLELKANGTTILVSRVTSETGIRLSTGVAIPAGASVTATVAGINPTTATPLDTWNRGMTLTGYIQ